MPNTLPSHVGKFQNSALQSSHLSPITLHLQLHFPFSSHLLFSLPSVLHLQAKIQKYILVSRISVLLDNYLEFEEEN